MSVSGLFSDFGESEVFFHLPYRKRDRFLPVFYEHLLNPEFYLAGSDLDGFERQEFDGIVGRFRSLGARFTIHAPFFDLSPGALDSKVRTATEERYREIAALGALIGVRTMVFHSGYDSLRFGGFESTYIRHAAPLFSRVARLLASGGGTVALENTFDANGDFLAALIDAIGEPNVGLCLDVGHENIFSKLGAKAWIERFGSRIVELHLHDNRGREDEHLPPGVGTIDFEMIGRVLRSLPTRPTLTFEMHTPEDIVAVRGPRNSVP